MSGLRKEVEGSLSVPPKNLLRNGRMRVSSPLWSTKRLWPDGSMWMVRSCGKYSNGIGEREGEGLAGYCGMEGEDGYSVGAGVGIGVGFFLLENRC